jgi:2-polyprenyl-3-methyl-5-hydroxy-6-metoxy-1,4-benzoquinol methylase
MNITVHSSERYSRDELERIDGDPVTINLGCGTDERGVGIDINYEPDIMHDLNQDIPIEDGAADHIIAYHILEHLDDPTHFFEECRRVLGDSGTLNLEVPNVAWLPVRLWLTQDLQRFWSHKDPDRSGHWLARRLGNTDHRRTGHRTLWTKQLLAEYFERAGFEYAIEGWHGSRNLQAEASISQPTGQPSRTLHELERESGADLASQDYWAQTRARILSKWVSERDPETVLDAGCGSGYLTEMIASDTDADVLGIDIAAGSIELAKQRDTSACFKVDDATSLSDWSDTYDVILFADVLEHFERPERVVRPAAEALEPDGSVMVSLPAHEWLWGPHDEHNDHHARYDRDSLSDIADASGLTVKRTRNTNAIPLVPYWLFQRVLDRPVPDSARGGHSRLVEAAKSACIGIETRLAPPVGVTLIGELVQD